jgi:tRNA pseudouridine38-40 synthase
MRYALKFGYDGKNYSGYARQPNLRTIEGEIFIAMLETRMVADPGSFKINVASRTDKGVSALGNVISITTDFRSDEIVSALNAYLDDIWFYGIAKVPDDFNPRFAKSRWYRYHIFSHDHDMESLKKAASLFVGIHNFSNFAKLEEQDPNLKVDSIEVSKHENVIVLDFHAQRFLWHMVRRIMSGILDVEKGKVSPSEIEDALLGMEKVDFGITIPQPLLLMDVEYDFEIETVPERLGGLSDKLEKHIKDLQMTSTVYKNMDNILKFR